MLVNLAYGRLGLAVNLPDDRTTVIEPLHLHSLPDPLGAVLNAIRNPVGSRPLRQLVRPEHTVAIAVPDIATPMPSAAVVPALLRDLAHVPAERVVVLVANGPRRGSTPDEVEQMLGGEVTKSCLVVNHNAFDEANLARCGDTPEGVPIWLNRRWVESDVRITVGLVEPDFFAQFSGGPTTVAPGLAGLETILALTGATRTSYPDSTWGAPEGNPIHGSACQIASQAGVDFSVEATANRDGKLTSVYAGELLAAHRAACQVARRAALRPVRRRFQVAVTTGGGYPRDTNIHQALQGIAAAAQVVVPGGAIICAAECSEGFPDHSLRDQILLGSVQNIAMGGSREGETLLGGPPAADGACPELCRRGVPRKTTRGRVGVPTHWSRRIGTLPIISIGTPSLGAILISEDSVSRSDTYVGGTNAFGLGDVNRAIQLQARLYLKSDGLTADQVRAAGLEPVDDVAATISELMTKYGPHARFCALPQGPHTLPYLAASDEG